MPPPSTLDAEALGHAANTAARDKVKSTSPYWTQLRDRALAIAPAMEPRDCALLLNAFSRVRLSDQQLFDTVAPVIEAKLVYFTSVHLAMVFSAYAKTGVKIQESFLNALSHEIAARVHEFHSPVEICMLLNAMTKLGVVNLDMFTRWSKHVQSRMSQEPFHVRDLSVIASALARVIKYHTVMEGGGGGNETIPTEESSLSPLISTMDLIAGRALATLGEATPMELARLVLAFTGDSGGAVKPPRQLLEASLECARDKLMFMAPAELVNVAFAFGQVRESLTAASDIALLDSSIFERLRFSAVSSAPLFLASEVAGLLQVYSRWRIPFGHSDLAVMVSRLITTAEKCEADVASPKSVMESLGKLLNVYSELIVESMSTLDIASIAKFVEAMANTAHVDRKVMEALARTLMSSPAKVVELGRSKRTCHLLIESFLAHGFDPEDDLMLMLKEQRENRSTVLLLFNLMRVFVALFWATASSALLSGMGLMGCSNTRSNFKPVPPGGSTASPTGPQTTGAVRPTGGPFTCDTSSPTITGTYSGNFQGRSSQERITLQFDSQAKKINSMTGFFDGEQFSYSNIYYEFVAGQSWFSLRTFSGTADLLKLFKLNNMDQVRITITRACLPSDIAFGDTAIDQQQHSSSSGPLPELEGITVMQLRRFAQCMQIEKLELQNEFDLCREKYEGDVGRLLEKVRSQEVLLASVRTAASSSGREVERLTAENSKLTERCQVLEGEVRSVKATNEEMSTEVKTVQDLQSRLEHLTERCRELEEECDSLRSARHHHQLPADRPKPPPEPSSSSRTTEVEERTLPCSAIGGAAVASSGDIEELVGLLEKSTSEVERLQDQVALWRRRGEEAEDELEKLKASIDKQQQEQEENYIDDELSHPSFTTSTTPESTGIFAPASSSSEVAVNASSSLRGSMDSHTAERAENELLHFLLEGAVSSQEIEAIREEFLATGGGQRKWPASRQKEIERLQGALELAKKSGEALRKKVEQLEMDLAAERAGRGPKGRLGIWTGEGVTTATVGGGMVKTTPRKEDTDDEGTVCSTEDVSILRREIWRLKQEAVESAKCATNRLRSAREQLSSREVELARAQRAEEMAEKKIHEIEKELRGAQERLRDEIAANERLETKLKLMVAQLSLARSEVSGLRDEVLLELEWKGMELADTEGLLMKMEEQTAGLAEDTERFLLEYTKVCLSEERERMISNDLHAHLLRLIENAASEGKEDPHQRSICIEQTIQVDSLDSIHKVAVLDPPREPRREKPLCQQQDVVVFQSQSKLSVADSIDFGSEQMAGLTEYVEKLSAKYALACLNEERERMLSNDLYGCLIRAEERQRGLQQTAREVMVKTEELMRKEGVVRERRELMREDREGQLQRLLDALVDMQATREIEERITVQLGKKMVAVGTQTVRVATWNSMVQASPRTNECSIQTVVDKTSVECQTMGKGKGKSISRLTQTTTSAAEAAGGVHPVDVEHEAAIREEAIREIKAHMEEQVRVTRCNGQVRLRAREESHRAEVERLAREHQRMTAELERRHAEDLRVQRLRLERQWQVRRSMAEASLRNKEESERRVEPPPTSRRRVMPPPIRVDEGEVFSFVSSAVEQQLYDDDRPSPDAIRRASASRVVESVRSGRRRVVERALK
ncbi:hypothetical protein FOL47_008022 [Perkinsus chesapeaki]|uniref:Uncharacterized protein n=1 Tax=Perkinsus chesapeaki TaxID=330153 RepID=A0A7J6LHJ0_PERCH|nr:hypothetical protein FOL47_008022 [Perkinsus chesapeaki]